MNLALGIVGFFLICCAYAAQYWAYKSHLELKKLNYKLDRLLETKQRKE